MRVPMTLVVMLAGIAAGHGTGQSYAYVPDNQPAVGNGNAWPFEFSTTTGRFQQFLDARYLPSQPVRFTELAFTREGPASRFACTGDFELRMSHTTTACPVSTLFAGNIAPCPTELIKSSTGFAYPVPVTNTWTDIGTVADFGYDGVRNVCLAVRYRGRIPGQGVVLRAVPTIPRIWANATSADNFNATSGITDCTLGLRVRIRYATNDVCIAADTVRTGATLRIDLHGLQPAIGYQVAASLGQAPLAIGPCTVFLAPDGVFAASLTVGAPLFAAYRGAADASGRATASLNVPSIAALAGVCVHHAAVVFDGSGIRGCTNTTGTQIIP